MVKLIAAVSSNGIIGINGTLPFHYPEDLKHFKEQTLNCSVIMGRKTYESIGKPLPKRRNIVVTSKLLREVETASTLHEALNKAYDPGHNTWLIGGESIYREGMQYCQEIYLTKTPDIIEGENVVYFPQIDKSVFKIKEKKKIGNLDLFIYQKI